MAKFFLKNLIFGFFMISSSVGVADEVDLLSTFSSQYLDLISNKEMTLDLSQAEKGTIVVFISYICPCSKAHIPALKEIYKNFSNKGFKFYGVHSNLNEGIEESKKYFQSQNLNFPVLQDQNLKLAKATQALKTPHVFIFNSKGKTLYRGGIDEAQEPTIKRPAHKDYLKNALEELYQGLKVSNDDTRVLGCIIHE